jgi:1-acyl-sn-glycerol-3-phosphate acyltransferase
VPVVIHGARRAFPNRALVVRPGRITVEILEPIAPPAGVRSADELRSKARRRMLETLEEPDLAPGQSRTAGPHAVAAAS